MSGAPGDDQKAVPGTYSRYRQIIDDPTTRNALLVQVRGTVGGLRGAYRWHVIVAVFAIVAILYTDPAGLLGRLRWVLLGVAILLDVLAFLGLKTVARAPARWLMPLLALDVLVAVGLPVLASIDGHFHVAWLLLLSLPLTLLVHVRGALTLGPLLAEHHAFRQGQSRGTKPE